jgi:hypothetical protein
MVSATAACVSEFVALNVNVVPALEGPLIDTAPGAVSVMSALVAAFAVIFPTFVANPVVKLLPPMPPLVEVRTRFDALTVPVMLLLKRLFCELKVTVPTAVVALPIAAPTSNVPAWAFNVTAEPVFVLARSIVPLFVKVEALVAKKLKLLRAEEAPLIVTVPLALSLTYTLPAAAFAVTFATFVENGDSALVPTDPLSDVRLIALAFTVPVI